MYYFPKVNMDKTMGRCVTQEDLTIQVDEDSDDNDYTNDTLNHGNELQDMMIDDRHTKKVQSFSGYL